MANRTDKEAQSVRGTDPQNLIEYIVRQKIYDSVYWKQECFGLSAERIVDKGIELKAVGGMYGDPQKPTEFICLLLKMLQIQPEKEIIIEFIKNDDFKYLRVLGAFYMRLVGRAVDVVQYLEPLYNDYRKIRVRNPDGTFALSHIDEVIDDLLRNDYLFNMTMPHIPKRPMLEKMGQLEPRISILQEEFEQAVLEEEAQKQKEAEEAAKLNAAEKARKAGSASRREDDGGDRHDRKRGTSPWRLARDEERNRNRNFRDRSRSRSRDRRRRSRSRSRSRDRRHRGGSSRRSRSRSRSRDRHYDRRRRGSPRSRSRSRDRGGRDDDRRRGRDERDHNKRRYDEYEEGERPADDATNNRGGGDRPKKKKTSKDDGKDNAQGDVDVEIAEANALRAKLGLKPLK